MSRSLIRGASNFNEVTKTLKKAGWQMKHGRTPHTKWFCPCGTHIVVLPSSGKSRGNAFRNYTKMIEQQGCSSLEEE